MKKRTTILLFCLSAVLWTACTAPPVSVGHRESRVGQGTVFTITNTSDDHLYEVEVVVTAPGGETKTYRQATIEPRGSINVGWLKLDGWAIPAGSSVTVACKDYARPFGPWKAPN